MNDTAGNGIDKILSLEEQMTEILRKFSKGPKLPTTQARSRVVEEINTDLRASFLKCTVLPYGLDEVGVCDDETDLYLSVDTYGKVDVSNKNLQGSLNIITANASAIAQQIFKILTINSSSYHFVSMKSLTVYANTAFGNLMPSPVPEISFVHVKTNAKCKIRLDNYFCVQKMRLLNLYSRLDLRFWPLLMLVRHWGTRFNALRSADNLYFQNNAICLLLVFFLVSKKIIPSLKELQSLKDSGVDKAFIINNFDVSFCTVVSVIKPSGSVNPALQDKELRTLSIISILMSFFDFWTTFDFKKNVVCPYSGETFDRELFYPKSDRKTLPESIAIPYLSGSDGKMRPEKLYLTGPLCIQDIFELTANVTRTVSEDEASKFVHHCREAAKILEDVLNQSGNASFEDAFSPMKNI